MAANLLDLVSRALTPDAVQGLSKFLGESDSAVHSGLSTLVPALLGGLASKASTPGGASSLLSTITSTNIDTGLVGNLGSLLASGQSGSLLQQGSSLLSSLFGADKVSGVCGALSSITGMKSGTAMNLLLMAAPMVFSVLKKFIGENRLDAGGLALLLAGQKDFLSGKLDPRLTSALGLGSPANLLAGLSDTVSGAARGTAAAIGAAATGAGSAAAAGASGLRRWWPWIIGVIVALLLLMQLPRCGTTVKETALVASTPTPEATAPASASAAQLPAKVYFDTGKSELNAEGSAVVKSVAAMMAANLSSKIDVTGFTDKTGDSGANQELAKNRAMSVKAALIAAGVSADRIGTKPPMFVEAGAGGSDAEARRVDISPAQ
jgi:cytochrome c oxidase subunit 2